MSEGLEVGMLWNWLPLLKARDNLYNHSDHLIVRPPIWAKGETRHQDRAFLYAHRANKHIHRGKKTEAANNHSKASCCSGKVISLGSVTPSSQLLAGDYTYVPRT